MPLVIGVDSSTQSTKVEARNAETGEVMGTGSAPHPQTQPPVSEQDPEAWWDALVAAVSQLPDEVRKGVAAISVAGQQHGLVLVDSGGAVVRPAKLWNDTTSAEQASALVDGLGASRWAALCRSVPVAAFTITKLRWMADNEPESLARTDKIMLPHDYLTWRLTGRHTTDRGDASGTGWFDPVSNTYQSELLTTAVDDAASWLQRLPTIVAHDEAAGELTIEGARALGLSPGILVGAGSGDNMAAALGLGLTAGDVVMSLGTSGTIYSASAVPTADPSGAVAGFASASGEYLPLVCTLNATRVTGAVAAWLGTDAAGLSALASEPSARFDGCTLVPY
ncbi:MAG: xylulokinase, partial [Actinobacteria bacterium]|nr:xylulokinase [Actinomycetota bacterium]